MHDKLSVVGGGTLPASISQLTMSWPFVMLELDDANATVRVRERWRWVAGIVSTDAEGLTWSRPWTEIRRALVAPRKIVFQPCHGRDVRFVVLRGQSLDQVVSVVARQGVAVERISRWSRAAWMLR